jgi:hypothetical protein
VLVDRHVSVTYSKGLRGAGFWFLTVESGARPRNGIGCRRHAVDAEVDLRGSYLVVETEEVDDIRETSGGSHWYSGMAKLSLDGLVFIQPLLDEARQGGAWKALVGPDMMERASLYTLLEGMRRGAFSSGSACMCVAKDRREVHVCTFCISLLPEDHRVVVQGRFVGAFPRGRRCFFAGVTDAVTDRAAWDCFGFEGDSIRCLECTRLSKESVINT